MKLITKVVFLMLITFITSSLKRTSDTVKCGKITCEKQTQYCVSSLKGDKCEPKKPKGEACTKSNLNNEVVDTTCMSNKCKNKKCT